MHQRVFYTQQVRVTHSAAHDPAQDIAAPFVRRHHTIGDQERRRAEVVRDNPVVRLARPIRIGGGRMSAGLDQAAHQISRVVVIGALQQRRNSLDPHASVDRLVRQRLAGAVFKLLVLHEDEVPDFNKTVAIFLRRSRRATPDVIPVVIENLGARPAGAGWASGPEVVVSGDANDALIWQAGMGLPDFNGFFISMINGDQQAVRVNAKLFGQQVPSKGDRLGLEIVAKAEVAQHLEKRVVPRGITDVVEVIVLAARPHTFLR